MASALFHPLSRHRCAALSAAALFASGCATPPALGASGVVETSGVAGEVSVSREERAKFEQDRQAILSMAGDFGVTFDFRETVSFEEGYKLQNKVSGGHEVVRVIEDMGDFISLQHILVIGGSEKAPIKHWRQDWRYEPKDVLTFVGGNAWVSRPVSDEDREGAWSQVVYQVDDAPRYGAVAEWTHENGASEWAPPAEWRPLPRRDATTRSDYDAIDAVNRHAITPDGWVHEQDNSKLVLRDGDSRLLVREIGVNSYRRIVSSDAQVADDYWAATHEYWAGVRSVWAEFEATGAFGLTVQGEPEPVYMPILEIANRVADNNLAAQDAVREARSVISTFTTHDIGTLAERLARPKPELALADQRPKSPQETLR